MAAEVTQVGQLYRALVFQGGYLAPRPSSSNLATAYNTMMKGSRWQDVKRINIYQYQQLINGAGGVFINL